jgi:Bacterial Ig-like domain (group 3)/FG-GAP-like repeat/FG-GAP repeat
MTRRHTLAAMLAVAIGSSAGTSLAAGQAMPTDGPITLPLVATTTTLAVTPGPSVFGRPVIATATVTPAAAPGKVTFYDGTTVLGTRPLANGQASFTTSLLAAGTRRLRAIYIAEGRYYRSQSAAVPHVVDAAPQDEFRQPVQFDLQSNPSSLAAGDFNLNGRADLVATHRDGFATLMVGTGTGSFSPILAYPTGAYACGVAVADIDGDSFQDWVIANYSIGAVSVMRGLPGTFLSPVRYGVGAGPCYVATGDFNNDGRVDLATANRGGNSVSLLIGKAGGTFQPQVEFPAGDEPTGLIVADFNNDGRADLAVANSTNAATVSVLLGNGNGTFATSVAFETSSWPSSVATADFNADGNADLAVSDYYGGASVLLGTGTGSFAPEVRYPGVGTSQVDVGDVNGDGRIDVISTGNDMLWVLVGNGDGTFQPAVGYPAGDGAWAMAIADFNGDGGTDVAVANADGVSILIGLVIRSTTSLVSSLNPSIFGRQVTVQANVSPTTATGTVSFYEGATLLGTTTLNTGQALLTTIMLPPGTHAIRAVYLGDAVHGPSQSATLVQRVDAVPQDGLQTAVPFGGSSARAVAIGDFNDDGRADVAAVFSAFDSVTLLRGAGTGAFSPITQFAAGGPPCDVAVADVNHDGRTDVVTANYLANTVSVLRGGFPGSLLAPVTYPVGEHPCALGLGDFNNDGRIDIVVAAHSGDNLSLLLGRGDGTFQDAVHWSAGYGPREIAVDDFDGDGRLDLAVANSVELGVGVLAGNGDGTFQAATRQNTGAFPWSIASADVNADGRPDLLLAYQNSRGVGVLLGTAGGFAAEVRYPAGMSPRVTVGDVNGDGRTDIIASDHDMDAVHVLTGNGNGTFQPPVSYPVGANPWDAAPADFNGDGRTDLAVATNRGVEILRGALGTRVTLTTAPAGRTVVVDGTTYTTPQVFLWNPGTAHVIATTSPQPGDTGTRFVFAGWSDGGGISHSVTAGTAPATYTATFSTEHLLTATVTPFGGASISVTPASSSGYYPAGTSVQLRVIPTFGWGFAYWNASPTSRENPRTIVMNAPAFMSAHVEMLPVLNGTVAAKSGFTHARVWTITLSNYGSGTATNAMLTGLTLTQTFGIPCTPVVTAPAFPVALGNIGAVSRSANITIDFSGCGKTSRFTATISFSSNDGRVTGSIVRHDQSP